MPRDTMGGEALAAARTELPAGVAATPRKPGLWRAMGPFQRTAVVAVPLLGAVAGAAYLYGPPPAQWPAAVAALPGARTEAPKAAEPAPAVQAQQPQPAVAAPPGAAAQRRPGARTIEGTPPAAVPLAGMAQPAAAEAWPPAPAPAPAAQPAPRPQPQQPRAAAPARVAPVQAPAIPLPEPLGYDEAVRVLAETAYPEPDPLADLSRAVEDAKKARARQAAAPPPPARSPRETELAAMMTRLTAMTRDLTDWQTQDREDFKARLEALSRRLEDLDARLALSEARGGFYALSAAGAAPPAPQRPAVAAAPAPEPAPRERHCGQGAPVLGPQSYVVTSASPAMATLAHRNPMPGQAPLPDFFKPGDAVPCLGKIMDIAQEGTAWVVRTERGAIRSGPVSASAR